MFGGGGNKKNKKIKKYGWMDGCSLCMDWHIAAIAQLYSTFQHLVYQIISVAMTLLLL